MKKSFSKWFKNYLILPVFFTLLSLLINGYQLGRAVDVALVKHFLSPSLFKKDFFVQTTRSLSYTLLHRIIALWANLLGLEKNPGIFFFILYVLSNFLVLFILAQIAKTITKNKKVVFLFLLFFILNFRITDLGPTSLHLAEGMPQFAPNLLVKVFQLGSLLFLLKENYLLSFIFAGIALNFHPLSTLYLYGILALYSLVNLRRFRLKQLLLCWITSFLTASPSLFLIFSSPQVAFVSDEKTFLVARYLTRGLTTFLHFPLSSWTYSVLGLLLIFISTRAFPTKKNRELAIVFMAVFLMILFNYLLVDILKVPFGLMFSFLRASFYLDLLGLMLVTNYLIFAWEKKRLPRPLIVLAVLSITFYAHRIFAVATLLIFSFELAQVVPKNFRPLFLKIFPAIGALSLMVVFISFTFLPQALPKPVLRKIEKEKPHLGYAPQNQEKERNWFAVQHWSNSTPQDSLFLLLTKNQAFQLNSERATIKLTETSGNLIFSPEFAQAFIAQMESLGFDFVEMTEKNNIIAQQERIYGQITEAEIINFARQYQVGYLVISRLRKLNLPLVFQNNSFSVYQLDMLSSNK